LATNRLSVKFWRRFWLTVHLYLGLSIGSVMAVVGLTGGVMVFWQTFDAWMNPQLLTVVPLEKERTRPDPVDWVLSAEQALPQNAELIALYFPIWQRDRSVLTVRYQLEDTKEYELYVDPNTSQVRGSRLVVDHSAPWRAPLMPLIVKLHQSLLLGATGEHIVAVSALLSIILISTGYWLWWPKPGKWRSALAIKPKASAQRRVYDLHKLNGVYAGLLILILAVTGISMYEPEGLWIKALVGSVSSLNLPPDNPRSIPLTGAEPISAAKAVAIADELAPGGMFNWMHLPHHPEGVFQIVKIFSNNGTGNQIKLMLDRYSGRELWRSDYAQASAGDKILAWMYPLHAGYGLGLIGWILVCIAGLVCPILFITGIIRWLHKRRVPEQQY